MLDAFDHHDGEWFAEIDARPARSRPRPLRLSCAHCGFLLAPAARPVSVAGAGRHECENPAGLRFRLRLFAQAPGLAGDGPSEVADSWFPPYGWQVGYCGGCGNHLGWHFTTPGDAFCALIDPRFVEESGQ